MPDISQPWYTVQLDIAGCAYDVRVNGGPLYENAQGYPVTVELETNRWLRNGANELEFYLRPLQGQRNIDRDCRCKGVVYLREKSADRDARTEVARLEYPGNSPQRREGPDTIIGARFSAQVPFGLFRWFTSTEIVDSDSTRAELVAELERFHALLASRDIDTALRRLAERDSEEAAAQYRTVAERTSDSRRVLTQLLDETEFMLQPTRTRNVRLRIFGSGHLARLDMPNGQSPLYFLSADRQRAGYVELVFRRDSAGGWVVAR